MVRNRRVIGVLVIINIIAAGFLIGVPGLAMGAPSDDPAGENPVNAPPVNEPPVDAPPVNAPPADTPPVNVPPVDAPPVNVPASDAPPR